ncbi:hypothetical protein ACJ5NV_18045 [Loktanella agnita]|uniref:hypothetical protein n=1 Tax=Loktanella agnita TaxID=287097 RepID=UPI00398A2FE8
MTGIKYLLLSAVLAALGFALKPSGDRLASDSVIRVLSAMQQECNRHSRVVGGIEVGCRSFADVRKIDMRSDNRRNAHEGDHIVQIRR